MPLPVVAALFVAPTPVGSLTVAVPHFYAALDALVSEAGVEGFCEEWRHEAYSAMARLRAGAALPVDLDPSAAIDRITLSDPAAGLSFLVSLYPWAGSRPVVVVEMAAFPS